MSKYHLIASKGCGSMIVEAALALAKLPHEVETIPYVEPGPRRDRLLALNPLGQVPTLVLPIYPTFTYGDDPKRWAGDEAAGQHLRKASDEHRKELWRYFAAQNPCRPWVLGETFSALDLYVAVMTMWRPGPAWFKAECPALADIAQRVSKLDALGVVWARNLD